MPTQCALCESWRLGGLSQQKPFGRPCIICGRRCFVQRRESAICTCVLYDGFAVYESAVELKQSLQRATNDDDDVCVFVNDTHTKHSHKRKRLAMSILAACSRHATPSSSSCRSVSVWLCW